MTRQTPACPLSKLSTRRGASLSVALLFFLFCAVIGSVVLTAGTAASGRFSTLASNSRDSESVLSAASVVRDTLDGASVVITREKTTAWERLRTYTVDDEGGVSKGDPRREDLDEPPTYAASLNGGTVSRSHGLLPDTALDIVFGPGCITFANEAAFTHTESDAGYPVTRTFTVTPKVDGTLQADETVSVTAVLTADRRMTLTFRGSGGDAYVMAFTLAVRREEDATSADRLVDSYTTGSETRYTKHDVYETTETLTTTLVFEAGALGKG